MPILSAHAAFRMLDRCIDASKIDAALSDGVCLGHRCGVAVYARERLRVLVDVHGVVVTVWRVRNACPVWQGASDLPQGCGIQGGLRWSG